ncbi:rubrerythrin-like domain-containing protein [Halomarina pelagica]|nr:rubrerythrin-like domain-containing protein [Halomarina sp. BND7]
MGAEDPYERDPPYTYECVACGERVEADSRPGDCPNCGGRMRNISQSREK